jgi:PAS domain S-box-containing protein
MEKSDTKLRKLFLVLSVMTLLTITIGGYFHYSVLAKSSTEWAHKEAEEQLKGLGANIESYLTWSLMSVKSLSGLNELKQSLLSGNLAEIAEANAILDQFRETMKVNVCYLMDSSGNTIASSNRDAVDSFVGKNYGFRPYFKLAMQGEPIVYMALGVTSKKRGLYFSHPVYEKGKSGPLGVAVIKASIEQIEEAFKKPHEGILLFTDPHGVVFLSSHAQWLYHVLWKPSSETMSDIAKSRQFGKGPWDWTGVELVGKNRAVDNLGHEYHVHQHEMANSPGWRLVYLHDHHAVVKRITKPILNTVGVGATVICIFVGLAVFFLFKAANTNIIQRNEAQEKIRKSENLYRTLSGNVPGMIYRGQPDWTFDVISNSEKVCGYSAQAFTAQKLHWPDIIHPDDKEKVFGEASELTKRSSHLVQTYRIITKGGDLRWVEDHKISNFTDAGEYLGVDGIVFNITARKLAVEAMQESEEKFRAISNSAQDAIIIANSSGNVVFWNESASNIFGYAESEVLDRSISHLMPQRYKEAHEKGIERAKTTSEHSVIGKTVELAGLTKGGDEFSIELSLSKWETEKGVFYTGIVRDISERKQFEKEREKLIKDLQDALANVETLSGLLPICSYCKNIRDDKGYWSKIESYIGKHSAAEFSHGICEECAQKYYPDIDLSGDDES